MAQYYCPHWTYFIVLFVDRVSCVCNFIAIVISDLFASPRRATETCKRAREEGRRAKCGIKTWNTHRTYPTRFSSSSSSSIGSALVRLPSSHNGAKLTVVAAAAFVVGIMWTVVDEDGGSDVGSNIVVDMGIGGGGGNVDFSLPSWRQFSSHSDNNILISWGNGFGKNLLRPRPFRQYKR